MLPPKTLYFLTFLCSLGASFQEEDFVDAAPMELQLSNDRYIVEFETSYSDVQDDFANQNLQYSIHNQFDSPAFLGISIQLNNSTSFSLEEIKSLPSVRNVWPATIVALDFDVTKASNPEWNPHALTGVNNLHSQNILGDGVRIAIIDSGIDVDHEAFQNTYIEGYDFTEDPQDPKSTFDDTVGHGTFVSSIIVGNSKDMIGVAPAAQIKMYKVFGKQATTTDDIILAAMIKAYSENPDVISLSLGSERGYPSMPISLVASKISETIPIVFAAGNSGQKGPFRASSGASGKGVLAVASVESSQHITWFAKLKSSSGAELSFEYIGNKGGIIETNRTFKIDLIGNACFMPKSFKDKTEYVLMGVKGTCKSTYILDALNNNSYAGSIMFVSPGEMHTLNVNVGSSKTFLGLATNQVRSWLRNEISKGGEVTISFDQEKKHSVMTKIDGSGGQMNQFSSWGPTFDQDLYPHIAAPGGNVFGARNGGGYLVSSGTSYACPYIAGIIALYLSENGRVDPQILRNKIIGAGRLLNQAQSTPYVESWKTTVDDKKLAPLIQQGNGLIDVQVLWSQKTTILSEPYLLLNDTENRVSSFKIHFSNDDSVAVTYRFGHRSLDTVYTRDKKKQNVLPYWPEFSDLFPLVQFSEQEVTLAPGAKGYVKVHISAPKDLEQVKAPIFQGSIDISGSNGDIVTVPYIGSEFSAQQWTPFGDTPLLVVKDEAGLRKVDANDKFKLRESKAPLLYFNLRFASTIYSIDIVDDNYDVTTYQFPPISGRQGFQGPIQANIPSSDTSIRFPIVFTPISSRISYVQPSKFANGTAIPSGTYRLLCRALKLFGDSRNANDWQLVLTDSFSVDENASSSTNTFERVLKTGRKIKNRVGSQEKREITSPNVASANSVQDYISKAVSNTSKAAKGESKNLTESSKTISEKVTKTTPLPQSKNLGLSVRRLTLLSFFSFVVTLII